MRLIYYFLTFSLVSGRSQPRRQWAQVRCAPRRLRDSSIQPYYHGSIVVFRLAPLCPTAFCCVYVPRKIGRESAPDKKRGGSAGAMKAKSNNRGESYRINPSPCRAACLAPLVDHFADGPLSLCVSRADGRRGCVHTHGRRGHRRSHLREDVLPLVVLVHRPRDCVLLIEHRAGHLIEPTRQ